MGFFPQMNKDRLLTFARRLATDPFFVLDDHSNNDVDHYTNEQKSDLNCEFLG